MTADALILGVHVFATLSMCGLIWFVQVVHYPLFAHVGAEGFAAYERAHQRRTGLVVAPLMGAELVTAALLVIRSPEGVAASLAWAGLAMVAALWASTAFVQVRLHRRLERGFDARTARLLVSTNWARTALWTARGALAVWFVRGGG